ncbi:hypothetical protein G7054_g1267 [Neopestalotiopsis clavispora]|nr:hypothetical protein G7054_g1267 [Neopestalotiopsis clavispora]
MAPLFRADQVGSLIRPQHLLEAYGAKDEAVLQTTIKEAIGTIVKKQLDLSIRPITSGEYERTAFYKGFYEQLQGIESRTAQLPEDFRPNIPVIDGMLRVGVKQVEASIATGKIKWTRPAYLDAWNMIKAELPEQEWKNCKIALPSPTFNHIWLRNGTAYSTDVYASNRDFFADVAVAYRAEIEVLYDAGLRNIQIDDPQLTYFILESFKEGIRQENVDPGELLDTYVWVLNEIVKDRPSDLFVGIHLCRGNMPGVNTGFLEGSYEKIAEKLLGELDFDTFYLEFDDARSGTFDPLRFLPRGKSVTLGLISTKTPDMENIEDIQKRVRDAAGVIAAAQKRSAEEVIEDSLAISPQCGFASAHYGRNVGTEERMWEKLVLVRDAARSIWKDAQ